MAKNSAINISSTSSVIVTDEDGVLVSTSSMTNGQLLIGSTGSAPVAANITAGSGISITPGAGALTIAATGGGGGNSGGLINVQYLTTSGTYTATPGTVSCLVMAVGGGGGGGTSGGGSTTSSNGVQASASGGSGGAFGQKYYAVAPTGSAYVIGSGGEGSSVGDPGLPSGASGGATTFNNGDMHLLGGGGGLPNSINFQAGFTYYSFSYPGGDPDPSDNSDFTSNGATGGMGISSLYISTFIGMPYYGTGFGGDSMLGAGAPPPSFLNNTSEPGLDATGYGGGGSGGSGRASANITIPVQPGGNGAPGIIIVYEYS